MPSLCAKVLTRRQLRGAHRRRIAVAANELAASQWAGANMLAGGIECRSGRSAAALRARN